MNQITTMNRKKILIILFVAFFLLCILSTLCLGIVYKTFSSLITEGNEIKKGIITDVCKSHGVFSETEYKAWFTKEYRQLVEYDKAMHDIQNVFPDSFDCTNLETKNIIDLFKKQQFVGINYTVQGETAEISFPNEDEKITIYLVKVGNEWEINKIDILQTSG